MSANARIVQPGEFQTAKHYYPRQLNAQLHPMVSLFFNMGRDRVAERYRHLNPHIDRQSIEDLLSYKCKYLPWAGCDLFLTTTRSGRRRMVVIETNSCPSGQKSMPLTDEHEERGGYLKLLSNAFKPRLKGKRLPEGGIALIYDKNPMEATGYAATLADVMGEPVWLAEYYEDDDNPPVKFDAGVMHVRDDSGEWHPIRAAQRYVTQRPWNRLPINTQTHIMNPILGCLAGGRNKLVADYAYADYNGENRENQLQINLPETERDVPKRLVPSMVKRFGGFAVVKVPYSNAGQGVYTITDDEDLEAFMAIDFPYDHFIVQSLVGNSSWSSLSGGEQYFHVGTMPDKKLNTYVADLRMMVLNHPTEGFKPVAAYARQAASPLMEELQAGDDSRAQLVTNLSFKNPDGSWNSDVDRLLLMDRKDFNLLGLSNDDLISAFFQTCMAVKAIDQLARNLKTTKGAFRWKTFESINPDDDLIREMRSGNAKGLDKKLG